MAWKKLFRIDELPPGKMRAVSACGVDVVVLHGEQGLMVIPASCPHMDNPLGDGFFDGCVLTCNKHLWQWSIPDGRPMGEAEEALLAYESEVREGEVWVKVERELSCGQDA